MTRRAEFPPRDCAHCSRALARRDGESAPDFRARRFCDRECAQLSRSTVLGVVGVKKCARCGKVIGEDKRLSPAAVATRRFCGRVCQAKAQVRRITRPCVGCGVAMTLKPSSTRRFCTHSCAGRANRPQPPAVLRLAVRALRARERRRRTKEGM